MLRIEGSIQDYPWGNDWFIDSLLGKEGGDGPKAELWLGCHPKSPSRNLTTGRPLDYKSFPFLLKVLSIEHCLSLQVHPDPQQAKAGFAAGGPNYQDDSQKAEMFCALTPVTALCGFRPLDVIQQNFERIFPEINPIRGLNGVKEIFDTLYSIPLESRQQYLGQYRNFLMAQDEAEDGEFKGPVQIGRELIDVYPDDMATLAPFFLNVVHLKPLEAIFLTPRIIHCYVFGNGVELMNSSDNVLRAGLTHKHMDLAELKKIALFQSTPVKKLELKHNGGQVVYLLPDKPGFELSLFQSGRTTLEKGRFRIFICTEGDGEISGLKVNKGDAVLTEPDEVVIINAEKARIFGACNN